MELVDPDAYTVAVWLFVRGVGLTAVVAFCSLLVQLPGLYGPQGILPIGRHVAELRGAGVGWHQAPSVFWLDARPTTVWAVAGLGLVAGLLVTLDVAVVAALVAVSVCYLSFATVGQQFLSYQWDVLLLEATVVAVLLAALVPPSPVAVALVWFLVFRFLFTSGLVKLSSGDQAWRGLTALTYHFQTQPLPTRAAWWAHQLPRPVLRTATLAALAGELGLPFFVFSPWPVRGVAVAGMVGLQVIIQVTGNYGFFNLLSLVLLVPLVPDGVWRAVLGTLGGLAPTAPTGPSGGVVTWAVGVAAGLLLLANLIRLASQLGVSPRPVRWVLRSITPFRVVNPYGLFAIMTTRRPEITVEGSNDGEHWQAYSFRWKPSALDRAPRFNSPHQPRLDWQMWFAALGGPWDNPWFTRFLQRLLEGSAPVLRLLADNPFADRPPRYVRATLADYRFTDWATRRREGRWWQADERGLYHPAVCHTPTETPPDSR